MSEIATVILAAGKGTRMKSNLPKVLLPLNNRPMVYYVIDIAKAIGSKETILVVGHKRELVIDAVKDKGVEWVIQSPQMGTGHALMQAGPRLEGFCGNVLVLSGDVPLLRSKTIKDLILFHEKHDPFASVLTVEMEDPTGYGRLVRDDKGMVKQIVEEKDAGKTIRQINEINVGIYVFKARQLFETLPLLNKDNQQGEYYLPDVLRIYVERGEKVAAIPTPDVHETHGINSIAQLRQAEALLLGRIEKGEAY